MRTEQYEEGYNSCRTGLFYLLLQSLKNPQFDWFTEIKKLAEYDESNLDKDRFLCCHKCEHFDGNPQDGLYDNCTKFKLPCDMVENCDIKNKEKD